MITPALKLCEKCEWFLRSSPYLICTLTPRSQSTVFARKEKQNDDVYTMFNDADVHKNCPFILEHAVSAETETQTEVRYMPSLSPI